MGAMGAEKINPFSLAQTLNSRFSEKITSKKIRQGMIELDIISNSSLHTCTHK